MADLFEDEPDWYSCYRMMNMKSHKILSRDWALYYVELEKFQKASEKKNVSKGLGQWCDFLSAPHEPTETLDESLKDNEGIREVHEMLGEFTEDEKLRERYRLHEEWLRNERSKEQAHKEKLQEEKRLRKKAEAERKRAKAEKKKAEAEKKKAEAEKKKAEAESKERARLSVLALRKAGYPNKNIADMLGMSEKEVKAVIDDE